MDSNKKNTFPLILAAIVLAVIIWSGINPVFRQVWWVEIIPVIVVYFMLLVTVPLFRFSNWSYALMGLWLVGHTVGAHYTFANVPFDWVTSLLGAERNHFDRVGHFVVGFYAFPMAEWLIRRKYAKPVLAGFFSLFFIMALAASYEIIEWQYAVIDGGDAGIEFLGSQGDIWDAQKDMFCDTLGALTALILFYIVRPFKKKGKTFFADEL